MGIIMNKKTYILHYDSEAISVGGIVSAQDALAESIFLLMLTERGEYEIYGDDYGIKRRDLIGARDFYIESMIKRRVREAICRRFGDKVTVTALIVDKYGGFTCEIFACYSGE